MTLQQALDALLVAQAKQRRALVAFQAATSALAPARAALEAANELVLHADKAFRDAMPAAVDELLISGAVQP